MNGEKLLSGFLAILFTAAYFMAGRAAAPVRPTDFRDAPGPDGAFRELAGGSMYTADLPVPAAARAPERWNDGSAPAGPFPERAEFLVRRPADPDPGAPVVDVFSRSMAKGTAGLPDIPYLRPAAKEAAEQGVDLELILAVIMKESGFNSKAHNRTSGATGLMQILPDTAQWLGLRNPVKLWEPAANIKYGVKYLVYLAGRFGEDGFDISTLKPGAVAGDRSLRKVLAAYNAGPGNVEKYMGEKYAAKYAGIPPFKETLDYLATVDTYFRAFKGQKLAAQDPFSTPAP